MGSTGRTYIVPTLRQGVSATPADVEVGRRQIVRSGGILCMPRLPLETQKCGRAASHAMRRRIYKNKVGTQPISESIIFFSNLSSSCLSTQPHCHSEVGSHATSRATAAQAARAVFIGLLQHGTRQSTIRSHWTQPPACRREQNTFVPGGKDRPWCAGRESRANCLIGSIAARAARQARTAAFTSSSQRRHRTAPSCGESSSGTSAHRG